ncbi:MAG: GNAT family N-acetyltransferase [SAR86 cluster bacterium]|uniref:GNAT family N-acetyltransferase n=1 Tax=SAR86 cluster bacterium TaxID=2030880 RepID=A0A2A5CJM3_9GAMM|nr:MAG: GNAT family N-acetyltransferase [SAR86 cluster bacterium]
MPKVAITDSEINRCFEAMAELRPHLIKDDFVSTVREMEKSDYNLLYIEEDSTVVAVAGYRIALNLFMGKHLYVDDLVTAGDKRSKGYGEKLISWLRDLAKEEGCSYLHLDSGTHRGRAHKFYFEQGFTIASYHFSEKL